MLFPSLFLRAEAAPTQSRMLLKAPLIIDHSRLPSA